MICDILAAMTDKDTDSEFIYRRKRLLQQSQVGVIVGLAVLGVFVMAMFRWGNGLQDGGSAFIGGAPGPNAPPGEKLYNQYCFGCHGITGDGNEAANIPALNANGQAWSKSRSELETHILDGGETMPELKGLVSPDDAALLIDFIQVWWTPEQVETFNNTNNQ